MSLKSALLLLSCHNPDEKRKEFKEMQVPKNSQGAWKEGLPQTGIELQWQQVKQGVPSVPPPPKAHDHRWGFELDWQIKSFSCRLSAIFTATVQCNTGITADAAPARFSVSRSILPSLMNKKTQRCLNLLVWGSNSHIYCFPSEIHGLRHGGADCHPSFTASGCWRA